MFTKLKAWWRLRQLNKVRKLLAEDKNCPQATKDDLLPALDAEIMKMNMEKRGNNLNKA